MIRKPGKEDFRENQAIVAIRESKKIAVEGSKGIGQGMARMYLYFLGGIMAFGFLTSLVSATGGIGTVVLAVIGLAWWNNRQEKQRQHEMMLAEASGRSGYFDHDPAPAPQFAFPASVRREGAVLLDIGAVAQQAAVLFFGGFMLMFMFGGSGDSGLISTLFGIALVVLAVLVAARLFGHRKALEWDERGVTAWHLLGTARMQWSDVVEVTVETASRLDLSVYFRSGSSRNLVVIAPFNRLGGPTRLLMPVRLTAIEDEALVALVRDLSCWRAAGIATGGGVREAAPHRPFARGPAPAAAHSVAAPESTHQENLPDAFDPDVIMARYLREREELAERQDAERAALYARQAEVRAAMPPRVAGFGRKGL